MCELCAKAFDKLEKVFGTDDAEALLWNATCFPFSGETCLKQSEELIEKHNSKGMTVVQLMNEVEEEVTTLLEEWKQKHPQEGP
jgi:hypothetical protein